MALNSISFLAPELVLALVHLGHFYRQINGYHQTDAAVDARPQSIGFQWFKDLQLDLLGSRTQKHMKTVSCWKMNQRH